MCRRSTSLIPVKCFDRIAKFSRKQHRMDTRPVVDHYTALMSVSLAGSSDRTDEGFRKNRKCQLYTVIFHINFGFRAAKSRYTVRIFDDFYEIDWKFGFSWKMRYTLCVFDDFQNFNIFIKIIENANCIPQRNPNYSRIS